MARKSAKGSRSKSAKPGGGRVKDLPGKRARAASVKGGTVGQIAAGLLGAGRMCDPKPAYDRTIPTLPSAKSQPGF